MSCSTCIYTGFQVSIPHWALYAKQYPRWVSKTSIQDRGARPVAQQLLCLVSHTLVGGGACTRSSFILSRESRTLGTGFKGSNHEWARHSSPLWSKVPLDHQWPHNHCFWVKKNSKETQGSKDLKLLVSRPTSPRQELGLMDCLSKTTRGGFALGM